MHREKEQNKWRADVGKGRMCHMKKIVSLLGIKPCSMGWTYTWQKWGCAVQQSLGTLTETERKLNGDYFREQKYGRKASLVGRGKCLTLEGRKQKRIISLLDLTLVDDEISARFMYPAYLPLREDLCVLGTVDIPWALVTSLVCASCSWPEVSVTWRLLNTLCNMRLGSWSF